MSNPANENSLLTGVWWEGKQKRVQRMALSGDGVRKGFPRCSSMAMRKEYYNCQDKRNICYGN